MGQRRQRDRGGGGARPRSQELASPLAASSLCWPPAAAGTTKISFSESSVLDKDFRAHHTTWSPIHQDLSSLGEGEKGVVTESKGCLGRKGCGMGSTRKITESGFLPSQFSMATCDTSKDRGVTVSF